MSNAVSKITGLPAPAPWRTTPKRRQMRTDDLVDDFIPFIGHCVRIAASSYQALDAADESLVVAGEVIGIADRVAGSRVGGYDLIIRAGVRFHTISVKAVNSITVAGC